MRSVVRWMVAGSLCLPGLVACGHHSNGLGDDDSASDDGGGQSSGFDNGPDDAGVVFHSEDAGVPGLGDSTNCKAGFYQGSFEGLYSSGIIGEFFNSMDAGAGINIPVIGDVQLTLESMGSDVKTCQFVNEGEQCSNFFTLQNGTISGTADGLFPYFCNMTGTLDCANKVLLGGWITCTYCVGFGLQDGGQECLLDTPISQGKFAGPLTADYFYVTADGGPPSFGTSPLPGVLDGLFLAADAGRDPGTWNGAEALAGYSGSGPLPNGLSGTAADYLSDAGYGRIGVPNDYGGLGYWYASYSPPDAGDGG